MIGPRNLRGGNDTVHSPEMTYGNRSKKCTNSVPAVLQRNQNNNTVSASNMKESVRRRFDRKAICEWVQDTAKELTDVALHRCGLVLFLYDIKDIRLISQKQKLF